MVVSNYVIDGPCPCGIFERNKINLRQQLEFFEDIKASEIFKKFYLDRNVLQKTRFAAVY